MADQATDYAARLLGAVPADIPGLWVVPGLPELTTGQLLTIAAQQICPLPRASIDPRIETAAAGHSREIANG